jgi:hypothetical protein
MISRKLLSLITLVASPVASLAQAPITSDADREDQKAVRLEYMIESAAQYTIRRVGAENAFHREEPLLRWSDPVITVLDGITIIWTDGGRPVATIDIWVRADGETHHTLQSLSEAPLTGERDGTTVWHPSDPGLVFHRLPDERSPASTARQRLIQMRRLLRGFNGYVTGGPQEGGGRMELRALPQPLYRYQNEDAGILDGAVFALAKGTNPEVLVLLEAVADGEGHVWQYAAAPKTNREAEVRFEDQTILTLKYELLRDPSRTIFGIKEQGPVWNDGASRD